MKTLKTTRLKPNPTGKDRARRGGATAAQLGAEWADIENVGRQDVNLTGVTLHHIAYGQNEPNGHWEEVISFTRGVLKPGQVVRVHSGRGKDTSVLRPEDLAGADFHLFTGRDWYVWNNDKGDCAALWESKASSHFDKACYAPDPPEGVVLKRVADKLVPAAATASSRRY